MEDELLGRMSKGLRRIKMPIDALVRDAAPLLSLTPLNGLAKTYVTTPQVVAELRDLCAREHFQNLGTVGLNTLVKSPDVVS